MTEPFRCLLVDAPWAPSDKLPSRKRGAAKNYKVMSTNDLCRLELPPLADDCYLFFWCLESMQRDALRVIDTWGFTDKTSIIWNKLTSTGKPWFGMGRHVRASHERCIVAVKGRPKRLNASIRSTFSAKVPQVDGHYVHSAKPREMYTIIEKLCPGPRVELFARTARHGWTAIGPVTGIVLTTKEA